jgi:hypothetical protein
MSDIAKNLASFADGIAAESVNELTETEIAQVSGGLMEWYDMMSLQARTVSSL